MRHESVIVTEEVPSHFDGQQAVVFHYGDFEKPPLRIDKVAKVELISAMNRGGDKKKKRSSILQS